MTFAKAISPARPWIIAGALGAIVAAGWSRADEMVSPAAERMKADVSFLADDAQEGRAPGTKGIEAAADHIANEFKKAGLKPAPGADGYFQPFGLDPKVVGTPKLVAKAGDKEVSASYREDFTPLALGSGGDLSGAGIVFAGYGITAKDEAKSLDYDDYKGLDVAGKAVLVLRRSPKYKDDPKLFGGSTPNGFATFAHKASNAAKHGAKAILMVNDKAGLGDGKDVLLSFRAAGQGEASIPFLMLTRSYVGKLLEAAGAPKLDELEDKINGEVRPASRALEGMTLDLAVEVETIKTKNVVGVLEGSGPLSGETVVVGAHYDHLGKGGMGSLAFGSRDIHNGADDNASGSAMVIEMARRLAARRDPLPRRVVFMAFSGEERGLLGSAHYVEHPLIPLDKTVMMINFDMVGRLDDKESLMIYGTGTTAGLDAMVSALAKDEGFNVRLFADGRGGGDARYFAASDHFSFYRKDIPVLFLFTGIHPDYHRPSDDVERINFPGMARIADLGELLLLDIVRRPRRPEFVKPEAVRDAHADGAPAPGDEDPAAARRAAYLGAVPDYGGAADGEGVRLSAITPGSPADKAGMKKTDLLVRLGGIAVGDLEDYAAALRKRKPGDSIEVVVRREGKETTLNVTLGSRADGAKQK
ncbi:MAG TPA: M28 family peptidase [Isosphaeraceae bacterium]|jgi:Zn-dependent M28 family amino/carboxypeptidase|nr:M28 family peptidase [Isosphaeraceae bacterium]